MIDKESFLNFYKIIVIKDNNERQLANSTTVIPHNIKGHIWADDMPFIQDTLHLLTELSEKLLVPPIL